MDFILKIQYININVAALTLLNMNMSEYAFCAIVEQYQKLNGWCEPNTLNYNKTVTSLKYHIGRLCGLSESGTNKLFKRIVDEGYIEKQENRFRLTMKFHVLQQGGTLETAQKVEKIEKNVKKCFSEWNITKDDFTHYISELKFTDVNIEYYYNTISSHYNESDMKLSKEGFMRKVRQWLWGDYTKGCLRTNGKPKVKENFNANAEDTLKEFERYKTLVYKPNEHTTFTKFRDDVDTLIEYGEKLKKIGKLTFVDDKDEMLYNRTIEMKNTPGATKSAFEKRMAKYNKDNSKNVLGDILKSAMKS